MEDCTPVELTSMLLGLSDGLRQRGCTDAQIKTATDRVLGVVDGDLLEKEAGIAQLLRSFIRPAIRTAQPASKGLLRNSLAATLNTSRRLDTNLAQFGGRLSGVPGAVGSGVMTGLRGVGTGAGASLRGLGVAARGTGQGLGYLGSGIGRGTSSLFSGARQRIPEWWTDLSLRMWPPRTIPRPGPGPARAATRSTQQGSSWADDFVMGSNDPGAAFTGGAASVANPAAVAATSPATGLFGSAQQIAARAGLGGAGGYVGGGALTEGDQGLLSRERLYGAAAGALGGAVYPAVGRGLFGKNHGFGFWSGLSMSQDPVWSDDTPMAYRIGAGLLGGAVAGRANPFLRRAFTGQMLGTAAAVPAQYAGVPTTSGWGIAGAGLGMLGGAPILRGAGGKPISLISRFADSGNSLFNRGARGIEQLVNSADDPMMMAFSKTPSAGRTTARALTAATLAPLGIEAGVSAGSEYVRNKAMEGASMALFGDTGDPIRNKYNYRTTQAFFNLTSRNDPTMAIELFRASNPEMYARYAGRPDLLAAASHRWLSDQLSTSIMASPIGQMIGQKIGPEMLDGILKQKTNGQFSLADLSKLVQMGGGLGDVANGLSGVFDSVLGMIGIDQDTLKTMTPMTKSLLVLGGVGLLGGLMGGSTTMSMLGGGAMLLGLLGPAMGLGGGGGDGGAGGGERKTVFDALPGVKGQRSGPASKIPELAAKLQALNIDPNLVVLDEYLGEVYSADPTKLKPEALQAAMKQILDSQQ